MFLNKLLLVVHNAFIRDVAVSTLVSKTKAIEFSEKMNVKNFKASDGWLDRWKKRFNVSFKTVSGESAACTDEMVAPWKLHYQQSCPNMTSTRSTTPTNLACFIALNQISPYI